MPETPSHPSLLKEFAFIRPDFYNMIADFVVKENWGDNLQTLITYLEYNFEIAYEQGLLGFLADDSGCLFRAGHLVTQDGQPITILFQKNKIENRQPFVATYAFKGQRFRVRLGEVEVDVAAPEPPKYSIPDYQPNYKLQFNFSHYLQDHESRIAEILPDLNSYQRFLMVYGAVVSAHQIASQVAVPQWFRDKNAQRGGYKWLLPLRFHDADTSIKPDFVAALDPDDLSREYLVRTILPPEWAYANARAIIANVGSRISNWM